MDRPVRVLPIRPDVRFLKDEAKRRRRGGEFGSLAAAQFAIAREHGFGSWPQLATFIRTRRLSTAERAAALVRAACGSDVRTARTLLAAEPELARHDLATACVTGEADVVARILAGRPGAATRPTGPNGIPPILYACFTRLLRSDPDRAAGVRQVVRLLLAAGADPNTTVDAYEEAPPIYGAAGVVNDPELTAMLLAAGADPDEGLPLPDPDDALAPGRPWGNESLYHAAEFPDPACAELLLDAKPHPIRVSYCLRRALDFDNPPMIEAFLRHGADPNLVPSFGRGRTALISAVIGGHAARTVARILDAGASVNAVDDARLTALRYAVRYGEREITGLLTARGGDPDAVTDEDRWMGAISTGDAPPGPGRPDLDLLERAAERGDVELINRLVHAGADVNGTSRGTDLPPLHAAAYRGHRDAVIALLAAGVDPTTLNHYGGTALQAAVFGSEHCTDPRGGISMRPFEEVTHGDYPGVVAALLAAGTPMPDEIAGSPAVQELLHRHA
ncbi:ankyrin repeat domain-containing protein [Saccharothrix deserti]|uniref:ankyrin repeat domain-containing protein n=1 Tax=Saccharothrix deserti TaxID=2593674 RepID=UPI00131EC0F1|nr:ankyrin repeat domain-containing protein [Saccharothrix deserti]